MTGGIVVDVSDQDGELRVDIRDRRGKGTRWRTIIASGHRIDFGDVLWWKADEMFWTPAGQRGLERRNVPVEWRRIEMVTIEE